VETRGGAHEAALTYGTNSNDKFHFGLSFGIPIYSFRKEQTYREEDASGNTNNDFNFFEYRESYRTDGVGVNMKLGIIYRPVDRLRLGFAFHTPTWANMNDQINSSITTDTESYTVFQQPATKTSDELKGTSNAGNFEYNISTPYRVMGSVAYVINEVKDVKKQKGFVSADVEFVNYRSMRFRAADESLVDDVRYYNDLNEIIKERYKGALNLRLGGELKFNTIMGRLGFAYLSSPFAQQELKGSRMIASGGLGYRNKGMFVDLTYSHAFIKFSDVPYWLADKPNPIADGRNNLGSLILTVGFKFL
jgi:long-subunit fatty acid transport protein